MTAMRSFELVEYAQNMPTKIKTYLHALIGSEDHGVRIGSQLPVKLAQVSVESGSSATDAGASVGL